MEGLTQNHKVKSPQNIHSDGGGGQALKTKLIVNYYSDGGDVAVNGLIDFT